MESSEALGCVTECVHLKCAEWQTLGSVLGTLAESFIANISRSLLGVTGCMLSTAGVDFVKSSLAIILNQKLRKSRLNWIVSA